MQNHQKLPPCFLKKEEMGEMVYNTFLLGQANHQELHFKVKGIPA